MIQHKSLCICLNPGLDDADGNVDDNNDIYNNVGYIIVLI